MSIGFFLANPRAERTSIDVIVRYNKKRYKKGIGVSIVPKYWNPKKQLSLVPNNYRQGAKVNSDIAKWRRAIDTAINRIESNDVIITNSDHFWMLVQNELVGSDTKQNNDLLFVEYLEKIFIPRFRTQKSLTRIQRFEAVLKKIRNYEDYSKKKYRFEDIDLKFYRGLNEYMSSLNHSVNYFGAVIKVIRQVMKEAAIIDKLHTNIDYTHSDFKVTTQEVDSIYLTLDELNILNKKPIDEGFIKEFYPLSTPRTGQNIIKSYQIVKNRFLIGAYTGLRVSDFNAMSKDNVRDGKIYMITRKTKEPVVIPIHPVIQEILDSGFDLSLALSETKTRLYIKHLCEYAGINTMVDIRSNVKGKREIIRKPKYQLVGTHTARRSFLTNAYIKGEKPVYLMKISGHKKESTFLSYLRMGREETAEILAKGDFFQNK